MAERRGMLISFEGSEGCGKSTQIERLKARLSSAGQEILQMREPGGTFVGERIRDLLQHTKEAHSMCHEAELLLFAASRAQLVRESIRPALLAGKTVILDRFLDSTTVYQGYARGLPMESVRAINRFAVQDVVPDLTLLLDMDASKAWARIHATGRELDRMESQPLEFFENVRRGYLNLAAEQPDRIVVLDASLKPEELEQQIWTLVEHRRHAL
ncbi:MAG: dTMP kinase [Verrucomicrobiaceae bacterium]|nr:dTMP kinase [Verrucomicrobiaceae bacterium]